MLMLNTHQFNTEVLGATSTVTSLMYIWGSDDTVTVDTVPLTFVVRTRDFVPSADNRILHPRTVAVRYIGDLTVRLYANSVLKQTKVLPTRTTMGTERFKVPPGIYAVTLAFELEGTDEVQEIGFVGLTEMGSGR